MLAQSLILAVAAFTGFTSAQVVGSNDSIPASCPSYSQSGGNLTFSPDCIPQPLRQTWCNAEQNTCRQVCGPDNVSPDNNVCYSDTLTYRCVCDSGVTPNISDYQQSLPSFVCNQWVGFCVDAHPDDLQGQNTCHSITCGNKTAALDTSAQGSSSSSSSSPSQTASSTSSGSASAETGTAASSSSSSSASPSSTGNAAIKIGNEYGAAIVGAGLLALFGFAL